MAVNDDNDDAEFIAALTRWSETVTAQVEATTTLLTAAYQAGRLAAVTEMAAEHRAAIEEAGAAAEVRARRQAGVPLDS